YLVVESDELPKADQLAVFGWLRDWAGWDLRMVLDTAGKSLHGWFKWPEHLEKLQIKALLDALRCDPRLMTPSQPVRVAGAMRDGRMQAITWLGSGLKTAPKSWEELTSFPDQEDDEILAKLDADAFNHDAPPPEEPCIYSIGETEIAHPGNIIVITAQQASGKSSFIAAALAAP